ncbi:MAG TPA: hypothetical protein VMF06_12950, partial [Candidatus Limnocylindria bacterium]|nr:hypothetical protein [Candidatus Limnocylindria bacterium]
GNDFASVVVGLARGYIGKVIGNTAGSAGASEIPSHCYSVKGGHPQWCAVQYDTTNLMEVSVAGSLIPTVCAVYQGFADALTLEELFPLPLDCVTNSPGTDPRLLRFVTVPNTNFAYFIVVDGINGAQGQVQVSISPAVAPGVEVNPSSNSAIQGGKIVFDAAVTNFVGRLAFQWQLNGTNLPGATNALLVLNHVDPSMDGLYTVKVTNNYGSTLSSANRLQVLASIPAPRITQTNGILYLQSGSDWPSSPELQLRSVATLQQARAGLWVVLTNLPPTNSFNLPLPRSPEEPERFYQLSAGP